MLNFETRGNNSMNTTYWNYERVMMPIGPDVSTGLDRTVPIKK
jgi:hypothetical protein